MHLIKSSSLLDIISDQQDSYLHDASESTNLQQDISPSKFQDSIDIGHQEEGKSSESPNQK